VIGIAVGDELAIADPGEHAAGLRNDGLERRQWQEQPRT
jgi:hypothetical protein